MKFQKTILLTIMLFMFIFTAHSATVEVLFQYEKADGSMQPLPRVRIEGDYGPYCTYEYTDQNGRAVFHNVPSDLGMKFFFCDQTYWKVETYSVRTEQPSDIYWEYDSYNYGVDYREEIVTIWRPINYMAGWDAWCYAAAQVHYLLDKFYYEFGMEEGLTQLLSYSPGRRNVYLFEEVEHEVIDSVGGANGYYAFHVYMTYWFDNVPVIEHLAWLLSHELGHSLYHRMHYYTYETYEKYLEYLRLDEGVAHAVQDAFINRYFPAVDRINVSQSMFNHAPYGHYPFVQDLIDDFNQHSPPPPYNQGYVTDGLLDEDCKELSIGEVMGAMVDAFSVEQARHNVWSNVCGPKYNSGEWSQYIYNKYNSYIWGESYK